jgi:hypothetical protein
MRFEGKLITAVLVLILTFSTTGSASAQAAGEKYFPETGHTVRGEFLAFFENSPDALRLFGFPITEEFIDPINKTRTQYFQRVRFDLVSEKGNSKVQIAPLGKLLYDQNSQAVDLPTNGPLCRRFSSGFSVCYAFLQFYDTYHGAEYFGNPIGPLEMHEGRLVQYFEQARMEWRPELTAGERVSLTDLGRVYFDTRIGDPNILRPLPPNGIPKLLTQIKVSAFVSQALIPANGIQTIYVIVQDQYLTPVKDTTVTIKLLLPDGSENIYQAASSNADGISKVSFEVGNLPQNQVIQIKAIATHEDSQATTSTWFRIWW